jgi:hypothetical protein
MQIEGQKRNLNIGTGSNVSILQPGVTQKIISTTPDRPYGVTGESVDVNGCQNVSFALGKKQLVHQFLVCEIPTPADGLLCMDILNRIRAEVNLGTGELTFQENREATACNIVLGKRRALTVFRESGPGSEPQVARSVKPRLVSRAVDNPDSVRFIQSSKSWLVNSKEEVTIEPRNRRVVSAKMELRKGKVCPPLVCVGARQISTRRYDTGARSDTSGSQ